ncbi:MAG: hypothetical protein ACOZAM_16270 [Pseudomonadota bacterium]
MFSTHFILTVLVLLAAVALVARMVIVEKRPRTNLNPRLIPTTPVIVVGGLVALLALIHLVNLAGMHTGR